ncbi:MAG TPA: glycosyltransferase, partial [Acidobacteriota bacterium]|nr:glycosyltransferase [Acidobacteriota bacterium]
PIHPKFQDVSERDPAIARLELGLNPEKFTVFVNAGWVGGGNIPQIYSTLIEADLDLQMIFLAGRNEKLEKEAKALARNASFPISVIGYTDKMDHLMSASSLMISKLGGLTTFEALASQLPIIADGLTPPMPQEAGTGNLLEEYNAGVMLRRLDDIVPIVRRLLHDRDEYLAMKQAAAALGIPDATKRIVNEISNLIPSQAPAVKLIQG